MCTTSMLFHGMCVTHCSMFARCVSAGDRVLRRLDSFRKHQSPSENALFRRTDADPREL